MECACIDVINDGEPVSNYRKKTIKTRKEHKCYECDHIIQKGEECEYVEFRFYKENYRIWTCKDCLSVIKPVCERCGKTVKIDNLPFDWKVTTCPDCQKPEEEKERVIMKLTEIKKETKETFYYQSGSENASISFRNGKFSVVLFKMKNPYTRKQWKFLAEIEAEITKIEEERGGDERN